MNDKYISKEEVKKATRGGGLSGSTKKDLLSQFGDEKRISRKDFEKSLRQKGGVGKYVEGRLGQKEQSRTSFSSPRPESRDETSNRPKTSWWQAMSPSGGKEQSKDRSQAAKPRFGFGSRSSNNKTRDKLREQFGGSRKGVGYTSDRKSSDSSPKPRRSLFGKRFGK